MHSVFRICKASILLSDIELANWVCVWFVSVQTSLTTPVHLCKILYVPPSRGDFQGKKRLFFFLLCNIKPLCISLLPVYFIKVLQNYWNLLRYNWDVETLSCDRLRRELSPNLQFVKDFVKISNFYAMWQKKKKKKKYAIKVQSEVIGTSGSYLFGFVHSMYNHFIF